MTERGPAEVEFQELLKKVVEVGASDVHLKTGIPPVVRFREELRLLSRNFPALTGDQLRAYCKAVVPDRLKLDFSAGKEIDMAYSLPGIGRFRLNIFRHRGQVAIVGRLIPFEIRSLDDLALPAIMKKIATSPRGLVLVTGTAGSGKSTTLAAMINEWNRTLSGHIITIEDPIEYLIRDRKAIITQRELGLDTETFATGLRSALRQDPDVVMIGEMRDRDTIITGLNAAETGHFVLSTLHTKDALETVNRIIGIFDSASQQSIRFQLSAVLTAIVSQRLLPKADDSGVVVATEVLLNNARIREALCDPKKTDEIRDALEQGGEVDGMHTFDQCLTDFLERGLITKETAVRNASNPVNFELRLRGIRQSHE
jgi:twitching motility protein PilT